MQNSNNPNPQGSKKNEKPNGGSRISGATPGAERPCCVLRHPSSKTAIQSSVPDCAPPGSVGCTPTTPGNEGGGKSGSVIAYNDECKEKPQTAKARLEMPEGEFIDGKLGLLDPDVINDRLINLGDGKLYEDPDFPPDGTSLSFSNPNDFDSVTWMRPHELCDDPRVFVDGASRADVQQGEMGDCWFLSACASLAMTPRLIKKVINPDQPLSGSGYKGVVKVKLWRFGEWETVHMDDLLPTKNGALMYASSTEPREFWVAFIEKAYAKILGCYESLDGGDPLEAFVDMTGGLAETTDLVDLTFRQLRVIYNNGAYVACGRQGDLANQTDEETGLVGGHAYTVTDVVKLNPERGDKLQLVRVRNPWADQEWKGAWSDGDPRWADLDSKTKDALNVIHREDGEFWMDYEDFQAEFQGITIATLGPDFNDDGSSDTPGKVKKVYGEWVAGENAGGSRNNIKKFATNPQCFIKLTDTDDRYTDDDDDSKCSILVGLMQEHRRSERNRELRIRSIAFFVYKADSSNSRLSAGYLSSTKAEGSSGAFINSREVIGRFELDPGNYVIIPAEFKPDQSRSYLLRIFGQKPFEDPHFL